MRERIFGSMCIVAFVTAILSSFLIAGVIYNKFYSNMEMEIKNQAQYISSFIDKNNVEYNEILGNNKDRITVVSQAGKVVFDNQQDMKIMESHSNRPEIISALQTGEGQAHRFSDTLGKKTFYYAVKLNNGDVLRVASTMKSVYSAVFECVPYMIMIFVLVVTLAMCLARMQTKRIVTPINNINLEDPMSNKIYDELSPLLSRISKQNKQITLQLRELEAKKNEFLTITENMEEGLIIINDKAQIVSINEGAKRMLGAREDDYELQHIFKISRNMDIHNLITVALNGSTCEKMIPIANRTYQIIANPVRVENNLRGAVMLILDITEKQASEQLRREFSANVSHELKTPLTSISGYAEIIKSGMVKSEDIPEFAGRIYKEASRMIELVKDIIKISRLDEGNLDVQSEEIDLFAMAKSIVNRLQSQADTRNISLSITGEQVYITGIRQLAEEMIYNLCDNAIKYNRDDGSVCINISKVNNIPQITVEDTGIGISLENQPRIFERFYRVDKSHSKETGGTGLGLSIVKHSAKILGADIKVDSQENIGTKMVITFA